MPGEFVAIVGPSGCGKSTLLKLALGIEDPSNGAVLVDSRPPADLTGVGYVAQDHQLHSRLTAKAATELVAELYPEPRDRVSETIRFLNQVGMEDKLRRPIHKLSGGERRRVSLALELMKSQRLLVCDEPTSGLDPLNEGIVLSDLRETVKTRGITTLIATHAARNLRIFDRLIVFGADHEVVYDGSPLDALRHFSVDEFEEIYDRIGPPRSSEASSSRRSYPSPNLGISWFLQFVFFLTRDVSNLLANRPLIVFTLASPAAVSFLYFWQWAPDSFTPGATLDGLVVAFVSAFVPFFYGLLVASGSIVSERPIVDRELQVGFSPLSYIAAKLVFFSSISCLISFSVWLICAYRFELHGGQFLLLLLLAFILLAACGSFIGLFISICSGGETIATYVAIAIVLVSLSYPGPLSLSNSRLSPAFPIHWGYAVSTDALFSGNVEIPSGASGDLVTHVRRLERLSTRANLSILSGFCVAFASMAAALQVLRKPTGEKDASA